MNPYLEGPFAPVAEEVTATDLQVRGSLPAELEVRAELSANASPIRFESSNLSRRPRTSAHVSWNPGPWTIIGAPEQSPDLGLVLQEVVDQSAWRPGNSLMLLIRGSGKRIAQPQNAQMKGGPRLYIELTGH